MTDDMVSKIIAPLLDRGVMGAILLFIGWMVYKYVPVFVTAHKDFLDKTSCALDKLSEKAADHSNVCLETRDIVRQVHTAVSVLPCQHRPDRDCG